MALVGNFCNCNSRCVVKQTLISSAKKIAADYLSQSLNCLVVPLPPSRHDDNCSIGTIGGGRMPDAIAPHACSFNSSADYELALILKEIRFITDQVSEHSTTTIYFMLRQCQCQ
jgi:hypothetical protein